MLWLVPFVVDEWQVPLADDATIDACAEHEGLGLSIRHFEFLHPSDAGSLCFLEGVERHDGVGDVG